MLKFNFILTRFPPPLFLVKFSTEKNFILSKVALDNFYYILLPDSCSIEIVHFTLTRVNLLLQKTHVFGHQVFWLREKIILPKFVCHLMCTFYILDPLALLVFIISPFSLSNVSQFSSPLWPFVLFQFMCNPFTLFWLLLLFLSI